MTVLVKFVNNNYISDTIFVILIKEIVTVKANNVSKDILMSTGATRSPNGGM